MKDIDINYICTVIGNLAGIPVRVFTGNQMSFYHSVVSLPRDPMTPYKDELWKITGSIGYLATEDFSFYGVVNSAETKIIVGPTRQIPCTEQELHQIAFLINVPQDELDAFLAGMRSIIPMPLESILQMLCTVNYILNDEKLELTDIEIHDTEQEYLKRTTEITRANRVESQPTMNLHNTMSIEETLMNIISHGDTAALMEWLAQAPAVRGGTLAEGQLRQRKNMFIVTATLASRAAIRGGLDVEDALSLSDSFIQRCELLPSPDSIANLQYHMVLEYTQRVERIRHGKKPTKLAIAVANYIQLHLSEPITAEAIAAALYMSRPHLSTKFKEETGETLTDFILKEKTEEAKRLLRYTDKTASQISVYLGFSSHGHFSKVFKKYAGMNPVDYREKHT